MKEETSTCEPDYSKFGKKSKKKTKIVPCPICGDHPVEIEESNLRIDPTAKIYQPVVFAEANHKITIEKNCSIGQFTFIAARKFYMFEGAQISPQATIGGGGDVYLHKFSVIGFGARLFPATDSAEGIYMCDSKPESERAVIRGSIHVGEGVYIGANAVICVSKRCKDIVIGEHSVVGAGFYLDHSLPSNTVIHLRRGYVGFDVKERKRKKGK